MQKRLLRSILLTACVFATQTVVAANQEEVSNHYYIGVGGGLSFLTPETNSVAFTLSEDTDLGVKLFGGYRFNKNWDFEAYWSGFGEAEISSTATGNVVGKIVYKSYGASAIYNYPIADKWTLFAKGGAGRLSSNGNGVVIQRVEDNFIFAGGGIDWNADKTWGLRAEYEFFDTDVQFLSFSFIKRFGSEYEKMKQTLKDVASGKHSFGLMPAVATENDTDADGILNTEDKCMDSLKGDWVDAEGCSRINQIADGIVFNFNSADLSKEVRQKLDSVAELLHKMPFGYVVEIRAHTDLTGTALYNYSLSLARARNVRNYLSLKGIAYGVLKAEGYGEWNPLFDNKVKADRYKNRRVELFIIRPQYPLPNSGLQDQPFTK